MLIISMTIRMIIAAIIIAALAALYQFGLPI